MSEDTKEPLIGVMTLMRMALSGIDLSPLRAQMIERATRNPQDAHAWMDLSKIMQINGNGELATATHGEALKIQQLYHLPAPGGTTGMRMLALMGPGDVMSNTPLEFLLEGSDVALDLLFLGPDHPFPASVPDHDVLFVALGENDAYRPLLSQIESLVPTWPRPVVNRPDRILLLSRDGASTLLRSVPGVVMPLTARVHRETLERIGQEELPITAILDDGVFPILARPVGTHGGKGLLKLDEPKAIADYLTARPEREFYVARFVDYRGPDGLYRKFRIVLITGRPFAIHMGISDDWMIHYVNARMFESAEKRAEEERWMSTFEEDFARRHEAALRVLDERIGLEYVTFDCGETSDGRLLLFEVDNVGIVHATDSVEVFPYKQPQMRKVFEAFREMLASAVKRNQADRL